MRLRSKAPEATKTLVLSDGVLLPMAKKLLQGVIVTVITPITPAMRLAGKHSAWRAMGALPPDSKNRAAVGEVAYVETLASLGVVGWVGVKAELPEGVAAGSEDDKEVPFSSDALASALLEQEFYDAIDELYVSPDLLTASKLVTEKNV